MSKDFKLESIGADPEVFISNNGEIVPCVGIIGGTKKRGNIVNESLSVLEDNVCLEWNLTPSFSEGEFISKSIDAITIIKQQVLPDGYDIVIKDMHEFSDEQLSSRQAKEFGCESDWNAYSKRMNIPPDSKINFRAAGGHLHFGINSHLTDRELLEVIYLCDALIGLYSVLNETKNSYRRRLYGSAGSFRIKNYGFEYRTPSNFWVNDTGHMSVIYSLMSSVFDLFNKDICVEKNDLNLLQTSINDHNQLNAKKIFEKYLSLIPKKNGEEIVNTPELTSLL